jgi:hypothetical protein
MPLSRCADDERLSSGSSSAPSRYGDEPDATVERRPESRLPAYGFGDAQ